MATQHFGSRDPPTNKTTREKTTARRARFTAAAGEALRAGCPLDTHKHGAAPLGTGAATDPQCLSLMGKYRVMSLVGLTSKQTESLRCCECPRAFSRRGGAPGAPRDSTYREPRAPLRLPSSCWPRLSHTLNIPGMFLQAAHRPCHQRTGRRPSCSLVCTSPITPGA